MPRYFVPITIDELKEKVRAQLCESQDDDHVDWYGRLQAVLGEDLKVSFDFENKSQSSKDFGPYGLMGYHELDNGLSFLGLAAGGDWEHPVWFMIYFDGTKLRGYIPKDGNPWNTDTNIAYGNDDKADLANAKKRYPEYYKDRDEFDSSDVDFDATKIEADIRSRIVKHWKLT